MPQSLTRLRHQIDHIIARQHGGPTAEANLALICQHCNLHKGPNIASLDPVSNALVSLFHPRRDRWIDHFEWRGAEIVGKTAVGRTTVVILAFNDPLILTVRAALISEGVFPPDQCGASE
jgi:hypothetical protein